MDVRGGIKNDNVNICHNGNTLSINGNAVNEHLQHGDILGSCSAIDMVSVLKKQRQTIEQFKILVAGEREQDTIPSLWKSIKISFELHGDIDKEKAVKAGALSIEKYCSVAETLRRAGTEITWEVNVINSESLVAR